MSKRFMPSILVGIALAATLALTGCGSHSSQAQAPNPTCTWSDGTTHTATNGLCPKDPGTLPSAPNHSPAPAPSGPADSTPPVRSSSPSPSTPATHESSGSHSNTPSDLPKLSAPDAKCPDAKRGDNAPAFNDGGQSLPSLMDAAAYQPTPSAIKCAEARLVAGGFTLLTPEEQSENPSTKPYDGDTFHVIWARAGSQPDPLDRCLLVFTVLDYEGNINQWRDNNPMALALDGTSLVDATLAKVVKSDGFIDSCVK